MNFSGLNAQPVAADIDGATNASTGDPIADLGLWIPASPPSTAVPANWYFLASGGTPLNQQTSFTPVDYTYDSSVGVPITGNFALGTLSGTFTPTLATMQAPLVTAAAPQLTAGVRSAAANITTPAAAPTSLIVNGTAGNDTVQLAAGKLPNTWILTVDGKSQTIPSSVKTLNLNGLAGNNQLSILGTGKGETAEISSNQTIFLSGDLTVTATNFTNTTVNGGKGSTDTVRYHDTAGNGRFVAAANSSSLTGTNYTAAALNFSKTIVATPTGKGDVASFYESTNAAVINDSKSSSVVDFSDLGIAAESAFFSKVQIYSKAGALVKTIVPTSSSGTPAHQFSATTLSAATSLNLRAAAAAYVLTHKKISIALVPALVDALLATYAK